ncbi:MAG: aminotransferase class I/II-fold pyridoxal phosphate-dependent enzyme [Candidatus Micrarchaeaceae archaeon]
MQKNYVSKRSSFASSPIALVHKEVEALSGRGVSVVKFDSGDPAVYFKTPKYIIDAYISALKAGKTSYSRAEGIKELVDAVADRYRRLYRLDASGDDVIVTSGLSEAFTFINNGLADPGEYGIIFRPYYSPYSVYAMLNSVKLIYGDYDESKGWEIDIDKLRRMLKRMSATKIKHIKYMLLTNPNNPTGTVLSRDSLKEIVDIANENEIFLISDEIYDELVFRKKFTSIAEVAKGVPYAIMNGASKDFDATGFRIGFIIVPGKDKKSAAVRSAFSDYAVGRVSVNTPAQYAVAEGISNVKEHERAIKSMRSEITKRIQFATKLLNENQFLSAVEPSGAFYIFPKIDMKALHMKSDYEFAMSLVKEKYVQVRSGTAFGSPSHFRMVSLAPKDILEDGINKINDFCRKHSKAGP